MRCCLWWSSLIIIVIMSVLEWHHMKLCMGGNEELLYVGIRMVRQYLMTFHEGLLESCKVRKL